LFKHLFYFFDMQEVILFNHKKCTDKLWLDYYHFIKALKEKESVDYDMDFESFKRASIDFSNSYPYFKFKLFLKDNEIIGSCEVFPLNVAKEEESQNVHIVFLEDGMINEFSSEIYKIISKWKAVSRKSKVETNNEALIQLLERQGFRKGNKGVYFNIFARDINTTFVNEALNNPFIHEFKHELNRELKQNEFKEFAEMMTILLNEMGREDTHQVFLVTAEDVERNCRHQKKMSTIPYYLLLRNEADKLIGISMLLLRKGTPKMANQFMTGVLKEHRGKGLSSWMKAYMYNELMKNHPTIETIITDCFVGNIPMIHINEKMGFKEIKRSVEMVYDRE
jgi:hypothetical protein